MQEIGGVDPFEVGLYGCSEMLNEGFRRLVQTGVIKRKVHDDLALMQRIENGSTLSIDHATLAAEGEYLHGAFYLGSPEFYEWLRTLPEDECRAIASPCSLTFGKLTVSAIEAAIMNSTGMGRMSMTRMTRRTTVRAALNQSNFGRSVSRLGSRPSKN